MTGKNTRGLWGLDLGLVTQVCSGFENEIKPCTYDLGTFMHVNFNKRIFFFFFLNKGSLDVCSEKLTSDRGRIETAEYLPVGALCVCQLQCFGQPL